MLLMGTYIIYAYYAATHGASSRTMIEESDKMARQETSSEKPLQDPDDKSTRGVSIRTRLPLLLICIAVFIVSASLAVFCAQLMIAAVRHTPPTISHEFIGLVLLPILVSNIPEHVNAVKKARRGHSGSGDPRGDLNPALRVGIESSLQIALLVLPAMTLINWMGIPNGENAGMVLVFDGFLVSALCFAVIIVNYVIRVSSRAANSRNIH